MDFNPGKSPWNKPLLFNLDVPCQQTGRTVGTSSSSSCSSSSFFILFIEMIVFHFIASPSRSTQFSSYFSHFFLSLCRIYLFPCQSIYLPISLPIYLPIYSSKLSIYRFIYVHRFIYSSAILLCASICNEWKF